MPLHLTRHVRAANVHGDIVFMDLRHDRYLCVAASDACALAAGLTLSPPSWPDDASLCPLVDAGLLSATAIPAPLGDAPPLPSRDLDDFDGLPSAPTVGDIARVAVAAARAWPRMRLSRPARWLERRHVAASTGIAAVRTIDRAARFREAAVLIPGLQRCLPNSLALAAFFKAHGLAPQLVFGVRTHGFEAHCWIQCGDVVLNDSAAHCRWFTPIAWS